jgi:hypothetical protein
VAILKTSDLSVDITIQSISGVKLNDVSELAVINYDVNAKLEEKERKSGHVSIQFSLFVGTKPSLVRFEVSGTITLIGKDQMIAKILETDPDTKTPYLLHKVYQRVFMSIFLLATILNMPYPPPNLLFSPKFSELFPEENKSIKEPVQVDKIPVPLQQNVVQPQQKVAPQKPSAQPQQQTTPQTAPPQEQPTPSQQQAAPSPQKPMEQKSA